MSSDEQVLYGGNVNRIVRVGTTVRRPSGFWSGRVHELLEHLENRGFTGAPRFLGVDEAGREVLTFIPGEVPGNSYPDVQPHMWSDETLVGLARLLRRYHDATEGFNSKASGRWQLLYPDDEQHEVICHNDAALYNVVFQNEYPVAFIDFDMAGPGPRMWDIAYMLYTSVPLTSFSPDYEMGGTVSYESALHAHHRRRRIRLFLDVYEADTSGGLKQWVIERLHALCDTLKTGAAEGNESFQNMIDEGHLSHYEREIEFVSHHFEEWE